MALRSDPFPPPLHALPPSLHRWIEHVSRVCRSHWGGLHSIIGHLLCKLESLHVYLLVSSLEMFKVLCDTSRRADMVRGGKSKTRAGDACWRASKHCHQCWRFLLRSISAKWVVLKRKRLFSPDRSKESLLAIVWVVEQRWWLLISCRTCVGYGPCELESFANLETDFWKRILSQVYVIRVTRYPVYAKWLN